MRLALYRASQVVLVVKNLPVSAGGAVWSLGWEDPLEKEMALFLPKKSHRQRNLAGYSPMGLKESDN